MAMGRRRPERGTSGFLDESQYFSQEEIASLMAAALDAWREDDFIRKRDAFLTELGLSTGLRLAEMAGLACADLQVSGCWRSVVVRHGKGNKRRVVRVSERFKERCLVFLEAKGQTGEPVAPESPVFYSRVTRKALTPRALQKAFGRVLKRSGVMHGRSIHALRHTYGTQLCMASGNNLRLVQRLLGHTSLETTAIYLHTPSRELDEAVEKLSEQILGKGGGAAGP